MTRIEYLKNLETETKLNLTKNDININVMKKVIEKSKNTINFISSIRTDIVTETLGLSVYIGYNQNFNICIKDVEIRITYPLFIEEYVKVAKKEDNILEELKTLTLKAQLELLTKALEDRISYLQDRISFLEEEID